MANRRYARRPAHPRNAHRQGARPALPDVTVKTGLGKLLASDGVGLAKQIQTLLGDLADDADAEPGQGTADADDFVRQSKLGTDGTNLILEQGTQWLDELELDVVRQATHIVVRLDVAAPSPPPDSTTSG